MPRSRAEADSVGDSGDVSGPGAGPMRRGASSTYAGSASSVFVLLFERTEAAEGAQPPPVAAALAA